MFSLVLSDELAKIAAAVPVESLRTEDIGDYAGRCFDYHLDHPDLVRLLHWEVLEFTKDSVPDEAARAKHYQEKVAAFKDGQSHGVLDGEPSAAELVFMVTALAAWWAAVPQVARMITGKDSRKNKAARARQRTAVVLAARRLAGARSSAH